MQQFLKPVSCTARARIVSRKLLAQFLIAVNDAHAFLYARLGRETFAPLAHDFESTVDLRGSVRLPYVLLVWFLVYDAENWVGQRDLHPHRRRHRARCCSYIMANNRTRKRRVPSAEQSGELNERVVLFRTPRSEFRVQEMALSRGFAPRAFSFAGRYADLLHLESE